MSTEIKPITCEECGDDIRCMRCGKINHRYPAPTDRDLVTVKGTDGPRASLPKLLQFEGLHSAHGRKWTWTYRGFRPPKAGEWYASGAIVTAYRAPGDLEASYHVVAPETAYEHAVVYQEMTEQPSRIPVSTRRPLTWGASLD